MELANQASTLREQMDELPEDAPERKPLQEEQDKLTLRMVGIMTGEEADAFNAAQDHAVVALVASWSFDLPITMDGVLDLPGRSYDALRAEAASHVGSLFISTQPDPTSKPLAGAPTAPLCPRRRHCRRSPRRVAHLSTRTARSLSEGDRQRAGADAGLATRHSGRGERGRVLKDERGRAPDPGATAKHVGDARGADQPAGDGVMAGELRWTGVPEFTASLEKSIARMSAESRSFVAQAAASIETSAKGHASGRPGPEVITGALRRGITHKPITPSGGRGWQTDVGPTVIYSRRIELGFHDADSRGRHYNQPAYPYFTPAYSDVSRTLPGLWKLRCRAALGL